MNARKAHTLFAWIVAGIGFVLLWHETQSWMLILGIVLLLWSNNAIHAIYEIERVDAAIRVIRKREEERAMERLFKLARSLGEEARSAAPGGAGNPGVHTEAEVAGTERP